MNAAPSKHPASDGETLLARLRRHWPTLLFAVCALGVLCWVSFNAIRLRVVTYEGGADYWEHSAVLHSLIQRPFHPENPHLKSTASSSRFGPQFVLIALVARLMRLDALGAMSLASIANVALFLAGIFVFFRTYFRHSLAPLYGLVVMLFGWWHGFRYSNVYQLNVLFAVASYPSTTALGLSLLGFAYTVKLLRGELRHPRLALLLLGIWAGAVFIIHPLTAMLSLSGVGLLGLCEGNAPWRVRLELGAALVAGLALSHFWPYFSPWRVVHGGNPGTADGDWAALSHAQVASLQVKHRLHFFYRPKGLLNTLGLALVSLAALPYFLLRRERWFVGLGALAMLLPFVVNAFVDLPLGHRFVLLAIVYLHIGVVWLLLKLTPGNPRAWPFVGQPLVRRLLPFAISALLLVFTVHNVLLSYRELDQPKYDNRRESSIVASMKEIAAATGPNAVVLGNSRLVWPLPTFGPKVVALLHEDPLVTDESVRDDAVSAFLSRDVNAPRLEIVRHYGVSHVLLRGERSAPLNRFLAKHAKLRRLARGYQLYTLDDAQKP